MEKHSGWYLEGPGGQAIGPFTEEEVLDKWRRGEVHRKTLCWREGMANWEAIGHVEPFASTASVAGKMRGKGSLAIFALLAVVIIAGGGFLIALPRWQTSSALKNAREAIAAGRYEEAGHDLVQLLRDDPDNDQALYLAAVATLQDYASKTDSGEQTGFRSSAPNSKQLAVAQETFEKAFKANSHWREQAREDLADTISLVPHDAPDVFGRTLAISKTLAKLDVFDQAELAPMLLDSARQASRGAGQQPCTLAFVREVLEGSPDSAKEIVALLMRRQDGGTNTDGWNSPSRQLRSWAGEETKLAGPFCSALLELGAEWSEEGKYDRADEALVAAADIDKATAAEVARRRLKNLAAQLAAGKCGDAAARLNEIVGADSKLAGPAAELVAKAFGPLVQADPNCEVHLARSIQAALADLGPERHLQAGRALMEAEAYALAVRELSAFLRAEPGHGVAMELLAEAKIEKCADEGKRALAEGDYAAAKRAFQEGLSVDSENNELKNGLEKAETGLRGKEIGAVLERAKRLVANDRYEEAERELKAVLSDDAGQEHAEAKALYQRIADTLFDREYSKAEELFGFGRYAEASELLEKAIALKPDEPKAVSLIEKVDRQLCEEWCERAKELVARTRHAEAETLVRQALERRPKDATANALLSDIRARRAKPETADLNGIWRTESGERYRLKGTDEQVTLEMVVLSGGMNSWFGTLKREGADLDGEYRFVVSQAAGVERRVQVKASIESPTLIKVHAKDVRWSDRAKTRGRGFGVFELRKEEGGVPGDTP